MHICHIRNQFNLLGHAMSVRCEPQVLPDVGPCKDEVFVDVAFEGMRHGYLATGDA